MQIFSYILFKKKKQQLISYVVQLAMLPLETLANTQDENIIDIDDEINFVAGLNKEFNNFMAD